MKTFVNPDRNTWAKISERPNLDQKDLSSVIKNIFEQIAADGDKALIEFTARFDGVKISGLQTSPAELKEAGNSLSPDLRKAILAAAKNIRKFHLSQAEKVKKIQTTNGVVCWRESRAVENVGIYIPGGTAPLFSTVLMLGIPAKIAGCKEIVLCSPPGKNGKIHPAILWTANTIGIKTVFKVGGAQAIAALTLGTKSIPGVDKIFGPGNQYVTAAKQMAQTMGVAIDMPAGPSEVLVIADKQANPCFVAADLLSQAEHGPDSQVLLVTTSQAVAEKVGREIIPQLKNLPRMEFAKQALANSKIVILKTLRECIEFSNLYAPEHLILAVKNAGKLSSQVNNAGSVFLGNYSCESAGDYASGTNHTLPTNRYARNYSGVSLDSFLKKITFQELSKKGIKKLGNVIETMADAEQLFAHKNAVTLRLKEL